MNKFLEGLRVQGARMGLKINVKKTIFLIMGISEGEEVILSSQKIDQVDTFTRLSRIISKEGGVGQEVKSRIAKVQGVFFTVEKCLEEWEGKCANQD